MKFLDCFCGMGGVSDGFALEGFDVTGIDIVDAPKMLGYKHRFIMADMTTLKGEDFRGFDVIWGSPPCRNFSNFTAVGWKTWKEKPDEKKGLELISTFLKFVADSKPKIWIMENVPRLAKFLELKPTAKRVAIGKTMRRSFWGNFPSFLVPCDLSKPSIYHHNWKKETRAWERARIPLVCSRAFARSCREALEVEGA